MHFTPAVLSTLSALPYLTNACAGHLAARQAGAGASPLTLGDDPPAAQATLGYTINHFSLIANDLDAMIAFYRDVLGLRQIFSVSIQFSIVAPELISYLVHRQPDLHSRLPRLLPRRQERHRIPNRRRTLRREEQQRGPPRARAPELHG